MAFSIIETIFLALFPVWLMFGCGMTLAQGATVTVLLLIFNCLSDVRAMYKRKEEKVK